NSILYFLSRFSVKLKVGFIILFLITGAVFWNLSYISINYSLYENKVAGSESLEKARAIEELVRLLQDERRASLLFLYTDHNAKAFESAADKTAKKLAAMQGFMQQCQYEKRRDVIMQALSTLPSVREKLLKRELSGSEAIRFYTDGLIKHLIDIIAMLTQQNSDDGVMGYFSIVSGVEYSALEADLTMAVMGEGLLNEDLFVVIMAIGGKAQSALDNFKRFAGTVASQKLYGNYRNGSFVEMNIQKENFRSHFLSGSGDTFDLLSWSSSTSGYIQNLRLLSDFEYALLSKKLDSEITRYQEQLYQDLVMLFIPLLIVGLIAYLIFLDINVALRTMLDFLSGRHSDKSKKERLLLLQSPSELGQVYRKLFAFNAKINKQIKVIRKNYEFDGLTLLPNRITLLTVLEKALQEKKPFTLLYIDVYNFSLINDSFGQGVGDIYLKEAAEVLKDLAKEVAKDLLIKLNVYRVGSDEFVIVCANQAYISRITDALTNTYLVHYNGISMPLTFTFGLANSNGNSTSSSILTQAELAVKYAAKHQQRYSVYHGDDSYKVEYQTNLEWVKRIKSAFEQNRFEVHYQCIVATTDEKCSKLEALIRLREEGEKDVVLPYEFLAVLQKIGLEKRLTKVVIDQSFETMHRCGKDISINMTRDDLDEDMLRYLERSLQRCDVNGSSVSIELVESEELLQPRYITIIQGMKALGCKIAIDDFGTGYSNFSYLRKIRPDFIKIDGSLIADIDVNVESRNVVKGIVDLAHSLDIKLIAEFVSTPEIYAIIRELGIEYAQGYHFGKAERCKAILAKEGKR
ncbi:MAG: EAL domain-containing protein, partial [Thiovulaceae bacterium]|nr:EAL domain-containing protein [Sulfurimonadaceae bacterium]